VRNEAGHPVAAEGFAGDVEGIGGEVREPVGEEGVKEGVHIVNGVFHGSWSASGSGG